jgi:hypothetical protein
LEARWFRTRIVRVPKRLLPLLVLVALSAAGCGGSHVSVLPAPSGNGVSFDVFPGAPFDVTRVVHVRGVSWFAAMDNGTVLVYRRSDGRWRRAGRVRTDVYPFSGGGDSGLGRPALGTGSVAPDFTVLAGGADTQWFALIGRIRGKWQMARFDYGRGPTAAIDAQGVVGRLVHGEMNGCGCAAGPETYTWFHFNGRLFVPDSPPGPAPVCSAAALDRAGLVTGGFRDRLNRHRALPFSVARSACGDGWALAAGTNAGGDTLAVYEQHGRKWLRAAVASPRVIGHGVFDEYAIPRSLLLLLGRRIHLRLFSRPMASYDYGKPPVPPKLPTPRTTAVRLAVAPGTYYQESWLGCCGPISHRWFAAMLESSRHAGGRRAVVSVFIYRWRHDRWDRQGSVRVELATPDREGPIDNVSETPLTGSNPRGFELQTGQWPGWTAVIARVDGRWRIVPFETGHSTVAAVEGITYSDSPITGKPRFVYSPRRNAVIAFRYRDGVFVPAWKRRFPSCAPQALMKRPSVRLHVTGAACESGFALAVGTKRGRPVIAVFSDLEGRGWQHEETVPRTHHQAWLRGEMPGRLLQMLEQRVLSD